MRWGACIWLPHIGRRLDYSIKLGRSLKGWSINFRKRLIVQSHIGLGWTRAAFRWGPIFGAPYGLSRPPPIGGTIWHPRRPSQCGPECIAYLLISAILNLILIHSISKSSKLDAGRKHEQ